MDNNFYKFYHKSKDLTRIETRHVMQAQYDISHSQMTNMVNKGLRAKGWQCLGKAPAPTTTVAVDVVKAVESPNADEIDVVNYLIACHLKAYGIVADKGIPLENIIVNHMLKDPIKVNESVRKLLERRSLLEGRKPGGDGLPDVTPESAFGGEAEESEEDKKEEPDA